jgi:hypothetical protein
MDLLDQQQALAASLFAQQPPARGCVSLNVGIDSSVWNCSQATPWGSVTQYLSLRA